MVDSNNEIDGLKLYQFGKLMSPELNSVNAQTNFIGRAFTKMRNNRKKIDNFFNRLGCFTLKSHHWENDASLMDRINGCRDSDYDIPTQMRIKMIRNKLEERVKEKSRVAASALTDPVETSGGGADKTHEKLYYEALGKWVSEKKIPIMNLNLKEEELILLAPHLTYLDLTDDLFNPKFTGKFIKNLLKKSENLTHLIIENSEITGAALRGSSLPNLVYLNVRRCEHFNPKDLSALTNLKSLEVNECRAFNPDFSALKNLMILSVLDCHAFNPDFSALEGLVSLFVWDCRAFASDLSDLKNLKSLKVFDCPAFASDLSALKGLESLEVFDCPAFASDLSALTGLMSLSVSRYPAFNPDFSALTNLKSLEVSYCPAFASDLSALTNLTYLRVDECPAFNPDLSALKKLKSLKVTYCHAFNPDLSALEGLESLEVWSCPAFNTDLSALRNLKGLKVFNCHAFNPDFSALRNLKSLEVRCCPAFNTDLSALRNLKSLEVSSCPAFNPDFSALEGLESLKVFDCPAFASDLSDLKNLKGLKVFNCHAFHPFQSRESLRVCKDLLKEWNSKKIVEFIRNAITQIRSKNTGGDERKKLYGYCEVAAGVLVATCVFTAISKVFREIQAIDEELSYAALGKQVSEKKIPIMDLNLREEELTLLAPHLTYIDLTDDIKNPLFTDVFIENLLKKSRNVSRLIIANSKITGAVLKGSPLPNLSHLIVSNCPDFNSDDLSALTDLESLEVDYCPAFNLNPDGLSTLKNLKSLTVSRCPAFNPDGLSTLKNLKSLKVFDCRAFNPDDLTVLVDLEVFEVVNCPVFHPFHSLESLRFYMRFYDLNKVLTVFSNLPPELRRDIRTKKPELLSEIETLAYKKDETGFSTWDRLIIPPAGSFNEYAALLELSGVTTPKTLSFLSEKYREADDGEKKLLDQIWGRICERYPRLAQGKEDIPELKGFIKQVLVDKDKPDVISLLEWDYKMNRDLPMTKDAFLSILDLIETYLGDKNQIRLALQTHPNLEEIIKAVKMGTLSKPFPGKHEFFVMSPEEQQGFLCRAVVLRERGGLPVANKVIKHAIDTKSYDKELLLFAMKLLQTTGIEGSDKSIKRLAKIIRSDQFDIDLKKQAALSLAELDFDPYSPERKELFLDALKTEDPALQQALIDSLGKYYFSNEDEEIASRLIKLADLTEDNRVKVSIAFTLSVIPREDALKKSLEIVVSDVWDSVESGVQGYDKLGRKGDYEMYTYRPSFHDTRDNMKRIIAERLVEMNRETLQDRVEDIMQQWKSDPKLQTIAENISGIEHGVRYVPFQVWLPKGKVVFRGINGRKGEKLANAAFNDLLMKGAGSADLSFYDTYKNGTWAKVGQMFTSATLGYVLSKYFDKDGVLMTIASDEINEMQLRRAVRLQHERSLHAVSYRRILTHQITQLFMKADRKRDLQGIVKKNEQYVQAKSEKKGTVSTVEKIAARQLQRAVGKGNSLQERVSYFNPEGSLEEEVRGIMREKGLAEASLDEIIEENVRRQIIREILAERLKDPELKACIQFASEVREAVTV